MSSSLAPPICSHGWPPASSRSPSTPCGRSPKPPQRTRRSRHGTRPGSCCSFRERAVVARRRAPLAQAAVIGPTRRPVQPLYYAPSDRLDSARDDMTATTASVHDPRTALGARLQAAVAKAFGAEHAAVDAMVRRSERADFQADLAMGLAKTLKRPPRQVAEAVVAAAELADICERVEIAGPGFLNLTLKAEFLEQRPRGRRARRAPRRAARSRQGASRRRLLGAERREGDARRPSALDDHRRCARAATRVRGPRGDSAEPHRRLGHAVRHADRALARRRRGRRAGQHGRAQRFLSRRAREVRQRPAVRRPRAATRRAVASRRCAHARAVAAARRAVAAIFLERLRAARRRLAQRARARRERVQRGAGARSRPSSSARASRRSTTGRCARFRRVSRTATASRCR